MKTQGIKNLTLLAIAILVLTGVNSFAQRGRNFSDEESKPRQNQICQMIPDLTPDQKTKIEALQLAHLKEMTEFRNQLNELHAKKQTLMTSDNADLKEINLVIDQTTSIQNKKMKSSAKHRQAVRSLLTDAQKVYFDSRGHRHGNGNGNGNGNGRGQGNGHGQHGKGLNCM